MNQHATLRPRKQEAGYSLVIAVGVIALLTMVGTMVLDQVFTDTQLAGGDRASQNAMFLAEAGAIWGKQELIKTIFPNNSSTANLAGLTSLTLLPATDPICPDGISCATWYRMGTVDWVPYGNGTYRVAATCSPACSGTPVSYTLRALGKTPDGAQRLVEIVVGQ